IFGVRAQEALDVRLRGQYVELLVLERAQILGSDLGRLFDLGEIETLAQARLAEAVPNLEHGGSPLYGDSVEVHQALPTPCDLRRGVAKRASARMLVHEHQFVETYGECGRQRQAHGESGADHGDARDPGS